MVILMCRYLLLIIMTGLCAQSFAANTYYKWKDEAGVTHYGETPPSSQNAVKIRVSSGVPSDPEPADQPETATQRQADSNPRSAEADINQKIRERNKAIKEKNCEIQRQNLGQIRSNGRIRETDDNGQTRYLSGAEIDRRRSEIETFLRDNCNKD